MELFDITLNEERLAASEGWIDGGSNNGLFKFRAIGPNNEPLGLVYMDLFHRQGKCPGAAHFTGIIIIITIIIIILIFNINQFDAVASYTRAVQILSAHQKAILIKSLLSH